MGKAKLKLVQATEAVTRPIKAHIHTKGPHVIARPTRHYKCLENAIPRITAWFVTNGHVGEVCEIYHEVTGLQIGTLKLKSTGQLVVNWIWDN